MFFIETTWKEQNQHTIQKSLTQPIQIAVAIVIPREGKSIFNLVIMCPVFNRNFNCSNSTKSRNSCSHSSGSSGYGGKASTANNRYPIKVSKDFI